MLDIGIDVFTHLSSNSSKGNELLELIVEILEPYFAKRSEHEKLHTHLTSNSGKTSGSSKGINFGDSDNIRIKFDTVNRNIDDINYELTEIRKKLTSKTGKPNIIGSFYISII